MVLTSPGGLLRKVRRHADLSQRELARRAGVATSVVSRIESGRTVPLVSTLERLLAVTGFRLQVATVDGHVVDTAASVADHVAARDGAGRHFPAHLDVRVPSVERPWWFFLRDTEGVKSPLLTFSVDRERRDLFRRQDGRTGCDGDERLSHPFGQSRVEIPGYRPRGRAGPTLWD